MAASAHAALGGAPMTTPSAASVRMLQRSINAAAASGATATASYTVRETTFAVGTVVREYVGTDGSVFAVAWQGPMKPDLSTLLGTYFPQYASGVAAAHAAVRGLRVPVSVDTSGLQVRTGGHMGAFVGRAWLPQALPAGMTGDDIQ